MRVILRYYWLPLLPIIFLSSCASFYNGYTHRVTIRTNSPAKEIVVNNEKHPVLNGEVSLHAPRNNKPLIIELKNGDTLQHISIQSRNSFNYIMGAFSTIGISLLFERNSPKRYYHQKNIYLDQRADRVIVKRFRPIKGGKMHINLGFPYANWFSLRTSDGRRQRGGFLGISGGLSYFYKENRYISAQIGAAIDNEIPIPFGVERFGLYNYERTHTLFANLQHNHILGSFDAGYGLSLSGFNWRRRIVLDTATNSHITKEQNIRRLGLSFSTHYRITKNFHAGLLYQPSLLSLDNRIRADYQHLVSAELLFKFRVRKRSRI